MNITSTTIIRQGEVKTENAKYGIEYSVTGGVLSHVSASVSKSDQEENPSDIYLGNIHWDRGNVNCAFQTGVNAGKLFDDFENIVEEIKRDVKLLKIK